MHSTDNLNGWYPQADRIGIPASNYTIGHSGRRAVVLHVTEGTLVSAIAEFTNPRTEKSAHFLIGKNGDVKQFVSVQDSAYANGLRYSAGRWFDPQGSLVRPSWVGLEPMVNPNAVTVSIEHEGRAAEPWTPAMVTANTAVLVWLAGQFASFRPYQPQVNLIGHAAISPLHRANCPGPLVDYIAIAAAANPPPPPPAINWSERWGPIATPDQTSWNWQIPVVWKAYWHQLGKCISSALYDNANGVIVQAFEGGDVRARGTVTEVTLKL